MRKYLTYAQVLVTVAALLFAWFMWNKAQKRQAHFDTPEPTAVTEGLNTAAAKCEAEIRYIIKKEAVKADLVPEYAKEDPNKQVTAAIVTPPHKANTTVTSVFDFSTGINTLSYRLETVPFFGFPGEIELGGGYGMGTEDGTRYQIEGRWTPLRIGKLHLAFYGELNNRPEGVVMAKAFWRWD